MFEISYRLNGLQNLVTALETNSRQVIRYMREYSSVSNEFSRSSEMPLVQQKLEQSLALASDADTVQASEAAARRLLALQNLIKIADLKCSDAGSGLDDRIKQDIFNDIMRDTAADFHPSLSDKKSVHDEVKELEQVGELFHSHDTNSIISPLYVPGC